MIMITCAVALLVASVAFTYYDRTTFLQVKTNDLIASARMIGSSSTAGQRSEVMTKSGFSLTNSTACLTASSSEISP